MATNLVVRQILQNEDLKTRSDAIQKHILYQFWQLKRSKTSDLKVKNVKS